MHFCEWKQEQDLYDKETNHGLNKEKQMYWETLIAQMLYQLDDYA